MFVFYFFFFFKQKTAYEMRISDWSSDVCSSDLTLACALPVAGLTCSRVPRLVALGRVSPMTGRLSARRLVIASALGEAGIDQQLGAVDVARRIAGTEQDGAGHLDGVGDAAHRTAAGDGGGAACPRAARRLRRAHLVGYRRRHAPPPTPL